LVESQGFGVIEVRATSCPCESPTEATLPPADPSLSAFNLLDAAGYTAALGQPVAIVEDDGGRPDGNGNHISTARVATVSGDVWEITLKSESSETAAMAEFKQRSSADGATPLAGVGDVAVSSTSLGIVRKGRRCW
jgi:hypothetical protein